MHAERPALARAVRLAHAAKTKVNRALVKFSRVSDTIATDDITMSVNASEVLDWHGQQAHQLEESERMVLKRIAQLDKAKDIKAGTVTNPRAARAKRKAAAAKSEARATAKRKEQERTLDTTLLHLRQRLHEIEDKETRTNALRAIDIAEKRDRFLLGGYTSLPGFPDWLRDELRKAYKLLVAIG